MEDISVQISQYQQTISTNTSQINSLKKDIDDLEILKTKTDKLIRNLESSAIGTRSKVMALPGMINGVIKLGLFSGILECSKGAHYNTAVSDLSESKRKIQNKIDDCNRQINTLTNEIINCNSQIQTIQANTEA